MQIPKPIETEADAVAAFCIYAEFWESPTDRRISVDDAAHKLYNLIIGSHDVSSCIYDSVDAIRWFVRDEPSALDFGLDIFRKAAAELPLSVQHSYGKGSQGAENIFKWYLVESSTFFQGNVPPQNLGKEDINNRAAIDSSNTILQQSEIVHIEPAVLQKIEDLQKARLDIIILLAMQGRCHSKNFARLNRGEHTGDHAVVLINNVLDRQHAVSPLWAKADFIGCCLLLRACARSLIEVLPAATQDSTLVKWKQGFTSFLHSDNGGNNVDNDFAVKVHAARTLKNLNNGPYDEESDKLFALTDWVF